MTLGILNPEVLGEFAKSGLGVREQAFLLDVLSAEATRFDELAGGGTFQGYGHFPKWDGLEHEYRGKTVRSHGAGLPQFEPGTWAVVQREAGLPDFSPRSQVLGAWWLAADCYYKGCGRNLSGDLDHGIVLAPAGRHLIGTQWARGAIGGPGSGRYENILVQLERRLGAAPASAVLTLPPRESPTRPMGTAPSAQPTQVGTATADNVAEALNRAEADRLEGR